MSYQHNENTNAFYTLAWVSFTISSIGTLLGIYLVNIDIVYKLFFVMCYLFSVSSCFTLAKVVRDKHESKRIYNKIESAKTEKYLSDINLTNKE